MINSEIIQKWLDVFGKGVNKKLIRDHVTSSGNHLWHLFTWGEVPCFERDEAREAFDNLKYTEALKFYGGYSNRIEDVSVISKVYARDLDEHPGCDVYVVAKDFSWTYVRTHEIDWCGPYFCVKNMNIL